MKVQRTPIASAVALLLIGIIVPAQAQNEPTPAAPAASAPAKLDAVVVTGIRGALQQSLTDKRDANTRVEVITAEDIGKMPDKNVADSLARVPGVTISSASATEGGFDENDRVSMRGTNPSLTQTLINGHPVASGDWFVLNQTQAVGRSVSYSLLPSELVGKIYVKKSSEASLVEGGVVGSVDIITRKPLDFRKTLTLEASVGAVYSDLPSKTDPQLSGLLAWKNEAGTFGVLAQLFSETRHLRRDGVEILGYNQIQATYKDPVTGAPTPTPVALSNPDLIGVWYPRSIGAALFEQERKRTGGLIDIQIKPSNELMLDFTAFLSKLEASNYNRNYLLHAPFFLNEGRGQAPDPGYVVRNNTLVSASFSPTSAGANYGTYDQLSRPDAGSESSFFNFDATFRPNDRLSLSTKLGHTRGSGKTPVQDQASWDVGGGGAWRLNGVNSAPDFSIGTPADSPAGSRLDWLWGGQKVDVKDRGNWAQVDAELSLDKGALTSVQFGARISNHKRSSENVIAQGPRCGDGLGFNWANPYFCNDDTTSPFNPINFPVGYQNYPGDFGAGLGGSFPRNVWYYTPEQLAAFNAAFTTRDPTARRFFDWEFALKERNVATYVQANLESGPFSGNVGLRLVKTRNEAFQYEPSNATASGTVSSDFGFFLPVTTVRTYNDVLPSANLKYQINKNLLARAALSKTMTRPDYSALAGPTSLLAPITPTDVGSGSTTNPELKPIRSTNFDLNFEWYFAPRALLSVGGFYMDLDNYVGLGQVNRQYLTFNAANPAGFMGNYVLTQPVNTSGKVKGIELAYEQPLGANFGVAANYTYTDAKDASGGPLVGASRDTYNLTGYFENDRINARLSVTHRSAFYSGLDRATAFSQAATTSVSASIGYRISEMFSINLDARNLNDPKLKYYALNEDQPRSIYRNGRQYYLSARVAF